MSIERMQRGVRLLAWTVWLIPAVAATAQDKSGSFQYYYFDEPLALGLDVEKVAVQETPGYVRVPEAGGVSALGDLGIDRQDFAATAVPGLSRASVPAAARSEAGVRQLVDDLVTTGEFEFVSPVFLDERGGPVIIRRDLLVRFNVGVTDEQAEAILSAMALGQIKDRNWSNLPRAYRVEADSRDGFEVLELANALAQLPEVRFAEPDRLMTCYKELTPNDPYFVNGSLWGLHNTGQSGGTANIDMDGPEAWDITTGDPSVIVVVIDDGVQQDHPDINQIPGEEFYFASGDGGPVNACDRHGTTVAGCVSGIINNATGVVGIAPTCVVASAKYSNSNVPCDGAGTFFISGFTSALDWAVSIGARVTNLSSSFSPISSISDKYDQTRALGLIHFSSSGNNGTSSIGYPSSLASVNAVGSITRTGARSSFSQYGTGLAFSAPGSSIWTTDRTGSDGYVAGDYTSANGTSYASPYAAGVAAMVLSAASASLTVDQVESIMQTTTMDLGAAGYDTTFGWGLLKAFDAMSAAAENQVLYVDPAATGGTGDGSSWANAHTGLQGALAAALAGDEVWVAAGTYTPTGPGGDRTISFDLRGGVSVYGGFEGLNSTTYPGGETALAQRNWAVNTTVLSGDLNGDDDTVSNAENTFQIVTVLSPSGGEARLDGLTITGGNADGDGSLEQSSSSGVYVDTGLVAIYNCALRGNYADLVGAAVGAWNFGEATMVNCSVSGNSVGLSAGAVFCDFCTMNLVNSSFAGNHAADEGGGTWRISGDLTIDNSIFWGNTDAGPQDESAQIADGGGGTTVVNYSCVQGLTGGLGGTGNTGADPLFVNADGIDNIFGTQDDDLRIGPGSSAIDAGNNDAVPADAIKDLGGDVRRQDDGSTPDTGAPPLDAPYVDMGAYEGPTVVTPETIVSAVSLRDHGGTELGLEIMFNSVEPRLGGVQKLELGMSGTVVAVSASVTCVNGTYAGSVTATPVGNMLTLEFDQALPDEDCCDITLSGDAVDTLPVRLAAGDIDRNGTVTTADASIIKPHFNGNPDVEGPEYDFDVGGSITTADFSQVKPLFNNFAPLCP